MMKTIYCTALALALTASAGLAQGKGNAKPWQGTFTKNFHNLTGARIFLDVPLPGDDKILTIQQISLVVGPWISIYGKVFDCQLESQGPIPGNVEGVAPSTTVLLPEPVWLQPLGTLTKLIPTMPVKIHATGGVGIARARLRLSCAVESMSNTVPMTVTAVGYTTVK